MITAGVTVISLGQWHCVALSAARPPGPLRAQAAAAATQPEAASAAAATQPEEGRRVTASGIMGRAYHHDDDPDSTRPPYGGLGSRRS
eukprot:3631240-Rhodomonas_salina.1